MVSGGHKMGVRDAWGVGPHIVVHNCVRRVHLDECTIYTYTTRGINLANHTLHRERKGLVTLQPSNRPFLGSAKGVACVQWK